MHAQIHASLGLGRMSGGTARGPLEMTLAASPDAPALARRAAAAALAGWRGDRREVALLVVSELITNAVRHGSRGPQDRIGLRVEQRGAGARIEVTDARARGGKVRRPLGADGDGAGKATGWGLPIVAELTDRWGVERAPSSTRVWCELDGR